MSAYPVVLVPHRTRPFSDLEGPPAKGGSSGRGCLILAVLVICCGALAGYKAYSRYGEPTDSVIADSAAYRAIRQDSASLRAKLLKQEAEIKDLRRELDRRKGRP